MARFIHFAEPRRPVGDGKITRAVLRPALAVHSRNLMASSAMQRTPAAPTQALQAPHPALQCPAALHHPATQLQVEAIVSMSLLTSGATVLPARYALPTTALQVSAIGT